ncbi:MAG: restriction endonuclease [Solobacterium sp.]|nr:restriction endonuclease [Solobacterium sp.]
MTGTEYERWCAQELAKLGYKNIRMTKGSHDQGIDLIASDRGISWGFQCKYYSSPVGNDAVQQAYAGMTYYGLDRTAVLTNQIFTAPAETLAEETGVELWENFSPEENTDASVILRIPSAILLICTLYAFFVSLEQPQPDQREMTVLAFALLSSASAFPGAKKSGALIFSCVCALLFIVPSLAMRAHTGLAAGFAVLFVLCLIRITVYRKQRMMNEYRDEKEELKKLIRDTRERYAEEIRIHLEDHLRTQVSVTGIQEKKDGTLVLSCTSAAKENEIALCEYTLNKEAEYEKTPVRFALTYTGGRTFTVKAVRNPDQK